MAQRSEDRPRTLGLLAPLLWVGVIFAFSLTADPAPGVDPWFVAMASPLMHAAEFLVLGVLLRSGMKRRVPTWALVLFAFFVASIDEFFIQAMLPGRVTDIRDIAADMVGFMLGTWMTASLSRLWRHIRWAAVLIFILSVVRFIR